MARKQNRPPRSGVRPALAALVAVLAGGGLILGSVMRNQSGEPDAWADAWLPAVFQWSVSPVPAAPTAPVGGAVPALAEVIVEEATEHAETAAVRAAVPGAAPSAAPSAVPPAASPAAPSAVPSAVPPAAPDHAPAPEPLPVALRQPVPILMYHELGDGPNSLYVRVEEFTSHLKYLQQSGYNPVTLGQAHQHLAAGEPLPPRPVVITFDDGYASFYETAYPLLQAYGFPATLFVITGLAGQPNYVTWDQVRELAAGGIELGAHSATHPDLRNLGPRQLQREVAGAKAVLEAAVGGQVDFFCYPAGKQNEAVVAAVREAGYRGAVTTAPGAAWPGEDPFLWPRIRVSRGTSAEGLARLIAAAAGSP